LKKYLALILSVLFVLSFAASAFAIHAEIPSETQAVVSTGATQITLGGELRVRGWWKDNITSVGNLPLDANSQSYYDERVRLSLDATVAPGIKGFVMVETNSGDNTSQSDVYTWGSFNQKPNSMNINEAWLMYSGSGLFGFNSGLKIGHMPLALGQKEFFDHTKFGDDAIVFFMSPTKQIEAALLTIKFAEGFKSENSDDLDGYVGLLTYKMDENNTIGVNYTYLNQSNADFSHQNLGIHANGTISNIGYKAFGDYQFGEIGDGDFGGWAAGLGLSFNVNPVVLRAGIAYGSGDDDLGDGDIDAFRAYLGNDQHYTLIYEYLVASAAGSINTGLENTGYINLGVDWQATKELGLSLDGYWLQASEDVRTIENGRLAESDELGWEIDGKLKYALAKNLTYQVDAGYFDAGDAYGDNAKGVTVLRHAITLSF